MRGIVIAPAIFLFACGTAIADDWNGSVKVLASYDDPVDLTRSELNLTVDAVYDKSGIDGRAWGTMSYNNREQGDVKFLALYYHVLCVGKFDQGRKYSVAGMLDKGFGINAPNYGTYMTFEFDVSGGGFRTFGTANTLAAAIATCGQQSGIFPAKFNHGYVIAK